MIPISNDVRFEVSTVCNYNCVICPHDILTRKKETMNLELFQEIFDKIFEETDQYTAITFPGMGEPLLDNTLNRKIKYVRKQKPNLDIMLLTNGSLLTPKKFKEFEDLGLTSVRVSFYGTDAKSYSQLMGIKPHAFERVKEYLLEISKIKSRTKLLLTMNIIDNDVQAVNDDWIKFWEEKVDLLEVWSPHNWVDGVSYRKVQNEKLATCGRPFNGPLQVQVDGTVNMCCFDYDGKLTLGDLKTQSLKEIFSSPLFQKIVACHTSGDFKGSGLICEHCDQRNKDKSDVLVYSSKFDAKDRVKKISTTYMDVEK